MKVAKLAFFVLVGLTAVNAAYLAAFDSATIFYHANVIAHVVLGVLLALALLLSLVRRLVRGPGGEKRPATLPASQSSAAIAGLDGASQDGPSRLRRGLYALAAVIMTATGLVLVATGTSSAWIGLLRVHEIGAVAFLVAIVLSLVGRSRSLDPARARSMRRRLVAALGALLIFPAAVRVAGMVRPAHVSKITNPPLPPLDPDGEGGGKSSPFFPSSNRTVSGKLIPSDFFLESKSCGNAGCHPDITSQWDSSAHHFSSFNNQWYRKSIEYMQDTIGTTPSKWCGGCHDMAILLTGRMDTPIRQQIDTPEAQAGIGCLVCHSIVHVSDTMGQGGFTLEYPEMHRLVASKNRVLQFLHDRMVMLDPGPHKATMLKPFHRESTPEFCSSCHKVHLDLPVNHYRWFRGFNDYDTWQQSGVSGQGARAFYYPPDGPKKCGSCHMPLVKSADKGNINGFVHSHRFPAANTALPLVNNDTVQFETVKKFLQDGILTVDVFAVSEDPAEAGGGPRPGRHGAGEAGASADAVTGTVLSQSMLPDEGGLGGSGGAMGAPTAPRTIVAPVERAGVSLVPGSTIRLDVVARTRKIGHFFPGGTVDAFDVWLEVKAEDADGRVLYWNGWVADDGKGPVDPGAHFYRALLLDDHGNRINKRNAWSARAPAYVRLIPPGAADTAHFRLRVPSDVRGPVKVTARMNYRKFSWWNTQWAFAGVREPEQEYAVSKRYDDGRWVFTGDTSGVSGSVKRIPDLPIIVVAEDTKVLAVGSRIALPERSAKDRERWNDFGIGLLLQRDFQGASAAFEMVTTIEPGYADGWVNRARVAVEEGDHARALELLDEALKIAPALPKAHYFRAVALRTFGRYDEALADLDIVTAAFPRDRVVWNTKGRILFLKRRFAEAVEAYKRTLSIDPEDVTAHYNLMLCYRGLKDQAASKVHERLYARFKIDESAQVVTGAYRLVNLYDNRERQPIHEHESTYTPENLYAASGARYGLESQGPPAGHSLAGLEGESAPASPAYDGKRTQRVPSETGPVRRMKTQARRSSQEVAATVADGASATSSLDPQPADPSLPAPSGGGLDR